ncbi:MAG: ABC transporter ATP-binding protein [Vulcanibacillus sp.]
MNKQSTLKRLLLYTKPHTKQLLLSFFILMLATGADVISPLLVKIFIDDFLIPRIFDWTSIFILALSYLLLLIASTVLNYFQLLFFQTTALKIIHQIRVDVFSKVQRLGLSFFDKTPAGSLISRITNDTEAIKDLFITVLSTFVQNIVFIVGILIAMLYLNIKLTLLYIILLPIIFIIIKSYQYFSSKVFHLSRKKLSQLNTKLNESLQGMNIIQAMRQEKRFRNDFSKTNDEFYQASVKQVKINALLARTAVDFIYLVALCLILGFFGIKSFDNVLEIGMVYAFINYLDRFFEPINTIMMRLGQFQQAIVASERVFELLDEEDLAPIKLGNEFPTIEKGLIEFKNVSFSYDGKVDVLRNISFTAKPGETVALVGQTGSGKSSISNLLVRFYPLKHGEILIDGIPLQFYETDELRSKIGLVLQDAFLFSGDIKHNIRLNNENINDLDITTAAKFVQADTFIEKLPLGYNEPVSERGATFSSGQRQLISFARTMAINPNILVLDEATASIDSETEELIQLALKKMRTGRTTIAIAHRLSTIYDANLILVLHRGEIVDRGTHQELLRNKGLYFNMYLLQQGVNGGNAPAL